MTSPHFRQVLRGVVFLAEPTPCFLKSFKEKQHLLKYYLLTRKLWQKKKNLLPVTVITPQRM
jgi:hypothetical protein